MFIKKIKISWVILMLLLFSVIEVSFFIANVVKIKERWMFLFFELFIFMVMYVWYYSRKINNRFPHEAQQLAPTSNNVIETPPTWPSQKNWNPHQLSPHLSQLSLNINKFPSVKNQESSSLPMT